MTQIKIRRNTMGEKKVEKGDDIALTIDRFRTIQTMNTKELQ